MKILELQGRLEALNKLVEDIVALRAPITHEAKTPIVQIPRSQTSDYYLTMTAEEWTSVTAVLIALRTEQVSQKQAELESLGHKVVL